MGSSLLAVVTWTLLMAGVIFWPASSPDDDLTRRTIYPALVFWAIACVLMIRRHPGARLCWSLGCLAFLVHVGVAFHQWHDWSHTRAVAHVQERSGFGLGIFFSYLFTLFWTLDAAWWWLAPGSRERRAAGVGYALHGYMGFIIFNGTVVYEDGFARWFGVAIFLLIGWWLYKDRGESRPHQQSREAPARESV